MDNNEHDKLLPIANVGRMMKQILPSNAKISKEAKQRMQECASEFISFVTGEASEKCREENRKTINGNDICYALRSLGLDNYSDITMMYLQKLRDFERQKAAYNILNEEKDEATCSYTSGGVSLFQFSILERPS